MSQPKAHPGEEGAGPAKEEDVDGLGRRDAGQEARSAGLASYPGLSDVAPDWPECRPGPGYVILG
jgi:hypothetical protein